MVCVAQSWIDSCGPKDATKLIPIDRETKRMMLRAGTWPPWVQAWVQHQIYQCRGRVEFCDGNYWRPCT